ncbi:hypothetical protein [Flavobacterium chungnamense]
MPKIKQTKETIILFLAIVVIITFFILVALFLYLLYNPTSSFI